MSDRPAAMAKREQNRGLMNWLRVRRIDKNWQFYLMLLIPLACNMFGIPNEIAMQVVAVGFIIGVLQDSCETALNSSTDALFTAAACMAEDDQLAKNALRG